MFHLHLEDFAEQPAFFKVRSGNHGDRVFNQNIPEFVFIRENVITTGKHVKARASLAALVAFPQRTFMKKKEQKRKKKNPLKALEWTHACWWSCYSASSARVGMYQGISSCAGIISWNALPWANWASIFIDKQLHISAPSLALTATELKLYKKWHIQHIL